jgi:hypothetical protein
MKIPIHGAGVNGIVGNRDLTRAVTRNPDQAASRPRAPSGCGRCAVGCGGHPMCTSGEIHRCSVRRHTDGSCSGIACAQAHSQDTVSVGLPIDGDRTVSGAANAAKLELCPPMAPGLLSGVSGDFGTSPFLSSSRASHGSPSLIHGLLESKHNGPSRD